jgi:SAM-dependent methyltransferase
MWTRRGWMAGIGSALGACPPAALPLAYADLPVAARRLAADLGLTAETFPEYLVAQRKALAVRVVAGSAEHITYYVLQSRRFSSLEALDPLRLAKLGSGGPPAEVGLRLKAFRASVATTLDERHGLIVGLFRGLPADWTLERCYEHTMRFLRERLAEGLDPEAVNSLYQRRGLSSDTAEGNTTVLTAAVPHLGRPKRVLLVGPGLDLTRREGYDDATPLEQPQWEWLRERFGEGATIDAVDIRPEVLAFLRKRGRCAVEVDITTQIPAVGVYDLAVATNLFVYLDDRSLLMALAGMARALRPGGVLMHNEGRFAAKVFGGAVGMPVVHFAPVSLGFRNGREQMDRAVIHRR